MSNILLHDFAIKKDSSATERVEFGLLSPEEIRKLAVVTIDNPLVYDRGVPKRNGIIDFRLGVCDRRLRCGTCNRSVQTCPGHFGCIELGVPMFLNNYYTDIVLKILRSVCYFCSELMRVVEETERGGDQHINNGDVNKKAFLASYAAARTKKLCPCCGATQPHYSRSAVGIKIEWDESMVWDSPEEEEEVRKRGFTSIDAHSILSNMSGTTIKNLGFDPQRSHPAWLVPDVLLVMPASARPAIMSTSGSKLRGQDDLTLKLNDINKKAVDVRAVVAKTEWIVGDVVSVELGDKMLKLQCELLAFVHGTLATQTKTTSASLQRTTPLKGLVQRLKGKEGRIRGNLMGKRTDYSGRSVITPDPTMPLDCVGVPHVIAKELTVSERVTPHNIQALSKRVRIGSDDVRGARTIITPDDVVELQFMDADSRSHHRLQFGDVVERFLQDGDDVIFNRQPSLHRVSFMGHKVKLFPERTFRLNLSVCNGYNADFDGDEMNVHVPQSIAARQEIESLMNVQNQVITPATSKPVNGLCQDALIGTYILTSTSTLLSKKQLMQCLVWVSHPVKDITQLPRPAILFPRPMWTGKQLFSMLLPSQLDIDYTSSSTEHQEKHRPQGVIIRKGRLVCGQLAKLHTGTSSGGIVDVMYREIGARITLEYLSNVQRVIMCFLMDHGFSVCFRDAVITNEGRNKVHEHITHAQRVVETVVATEFPDSLSHMAESAIFAMTSKMLLSSGSVGKRYLSKNSSIQMLIDSGSKGNNINIAQICSMVGQQSIEGRRVTSTSGKRTLSCYAHGDKSLEAAGFCEHSYSEGLTPSEFFFHNMGGREGLVDTAVKTASTGYIQRRMVKALEDMHAAYDGTVRNAQKTIVQFCYGSDGYEPTKIRQGKLKALTMSKDKLKQSILSPRASTAIRDVQLRELKHILDLASTCRRNRTSVLRPAMSTAIILPFSVDGVLNKFRQKATEATGTGDDTAHESDDGSYEHDVERHMSHIIRNIQSDARTNTELAIRVGFCSKALREARVPQRSLSTLFAHVETQCVEAVVTPGEAVGTISAQSMGEPTTQMTLNSFHYSGISSTNVLLGVPRLREILDCTHAPKTPMTTLWLHKPFCYSAHFAARFARTLPGLRLSQLVQKITLHDEPNHTTTDVDDDALLVRIDSLLGSECDEARTTSSRYVARCVLKKDDMRARDIEPSFLHTLLINRLGVNAHIVSSCTNCLDWVLRIRFHDVGRMMEELVGVDVDVAATTEATLVRRITSVILDSVVVAGQANISVAVEKEIEVWDDEAEKNISQFVIECGGPNVLGSAALYDVVDENRSYSNEPLDMFARYGIEAAVMTTHNEIERVLDSGASVDARHIACVTDAMCFRGHVLAMNRHGLNHSDNIETGCLVRASFEETVDRLFDAAVFSETEPAAGISYSVVAGEESRIIGTGSFDVLLPETHMPCAYGSRKPVTTQPQKRRLAKSTIDAASQDRVTSMMTGDVGAEKSSDDLAGLKEGCGVAYVDRNVWSFDQSHTPAASAFAHPFFTNEVEQDSTLMMTSTTTQHHSNNSVPLADDDTNITTFPPQTLKQQMYIPSSPKFVVKK